MVQLMAGGYWPGIGQLRGRHVLPEHRGAALSLCRVGSLLISGGLLTAVHFNSFLILISCASLFAIAAYLQTLLGWNDGGKLSSGGMNDEEVGE